MVVRISRAVLDAICAAARASPGQEICGLLTGTPLAVTGALPAPNVATEPERRFEIDPATLISAHRCARTGEGAPVIGCYHSHPSGLAVPSRCDRAQAAADGSLWLIIAEVGGADPAIGLWQAGPDQDADGVRFQSVAWQKEE